LLHTLDSKLDLNEVEVEKDEIIAQIVEVQNYHPMNPEIQKEAGSLL